MSQIFRFPRNVVVNSAGVPYPNAKSYVYLTGTSTLATVWTDEGLSVAGANPIVADASGVFPLRWLDDSVAYKLSVTTSADVLLYSEDPAFDPQFTQAQIGAILYPRTAAEIAAGVTPTDYSYPEGDPRRYYTGLALTADNLRMLWSFGHVPTYVDGDTFTVAGDVRSSYPDRTRLCVMSGAAQTYAQILSTSFGAGITTVETRPEGTSNLPASPLGVAVYRGVILDHMNTVMVDYNQSQVFQIINKNTGTAAATQLLVGDFTASGIGIIGTKSATLPAAYYYLAPSNPISAITTGLNIPLVLVTHDVSRVIIPGDGSAIQTTADFVVQRTNDAGVGGGSTSTSAADGTATGQFSLRVASVEQAIYSATTTVASLGTVTAIPLSIYTNGAVVLTIQSGGLGNYANDAAAAAGGVPVKGMYRNGSVLMVRVA